MLLHRPPHQGRLVHDKTLAEIALDLLSHVVAWARSKIDVRSRQNDHGRGCRTTNSRVNCCVPNSFSLKCAGVLSRTPPKPFSCATERDREMADGRFACA